MKLRVTLVLLVSLFFCLPVVQAQSGGVTVTGTVVDTMGELPGVSVLL